MFAQVLLPSLKSLTARPNYTYSVPTKLSQEIKVGQLVKVPFGSSNKPAIIQKIITNSPDFPTKPISEITIPTPLLSPKDLAVIEQISSYYLSSPHRTCSLFLPKQILSSKWKPQLSSEGQIKVSSFLKKLKPQSVKEITLTNEQKTIIEAISLNKSTSHLILGPTGSGKTEIYLRLLKKIPTNQQAIVLVPEISLTPQLTQYFLNHFPQEIAVWHSELNATEKKNTWWRIKNHEARIVIGSRSSLFLPYPNLGLIIIDEEHAQAFKQEQDPRYHARTVCQWLAKEHNCPLALGTATPSLSTQLAANKGRLQLHQLTERINKTPPPQINIVDIKEENRKGNFGIISEPLQAAIANTLANNKQILLFLNRRGFASNIQCLDCGHSASCNNCDVSLTKHQSKTHSFWQCHLCGQTYEQKSKCPQCHSDKFQPLGLGTQQVESEIAKLFPAARTLRADRDTTSKKHSFHEIYEQFRNHEADILIGTQMISKGLHLPKVDLVGIVLADIGLHAPDFQANETAYQLLTQVCGRAGRSHTQGQVIIQTLSPNHPVLKSIKDNNQAEFYTSELLLRQNHNYPPFSKITKLTCVDPNQKQCLSQAEQVEQKLLHSGKNILGSPALVFRQHNKYHYNILLFSNEPETTINKLQLPPNWRIDRDPLNVI